MTLSESAKFTKKAFIFGSIFLVLLFLAWTGYSYWYTNYYLPSLPEKVIPPEAKFGKLPKVDLPPSLGSSANYTFTLDTEDGKLPKESPKLMPVFFIPQIGATLLAPDRVKTLASSLGFNIGPEIVSASKHKFLSDTGGQITIDLDTNNFELNRVIPIEATPSAETLPDQARIIIDFKNYLSEKGLLKPFLKNGKTEVKYNKASQLASDQATLTLWPEDLKADNKDYPIVTPKFFEGLITAKLVKTQDYDQRFQSIKYILWEVDNTNSSTYPLKNIEDAYNELAEGRSVIVKLPSANKVSLTEIFLAYYQGEKYNPYLQPIFVFKGPDFVAYVEAITKDYLEESSSN